jgi:hypothetical protein
VTKNDIWMHQKWTVVEVDPPTIQDETGKIMLLDPRIVVLVEVDGHITGVISPFADEEEADNWIAATQLAGSPAKFTIVETTRPYAAEPRS